MSDQKTADVNQSQDVDPSGLGIGFGLAVFGLVFLLFPLLVPVDGGWLTVIFVISVLISVMGVGGILFELAKHRARPWLNDIGTASVVLGLASAILIVQVRTDWVYGVDVALVVVMFILVAVGLVGLGMGLTKASHFQPEAVVDRGVERTGQGGAGSEQLRRNDKFNIGVAIACTIMQCVVSIMIAVLTAKPS